VREGNAISLNAETKETADHNADNGKRGLPKASAPNHADAFALPRSLCICGMRTSQASPGSPEISVSAHLFQHHNSFRLGPELEAVEMEVWESF
jgi:hypothetical protein